MDEKERKEWASLSGSLSGTQVEPRATKNPSVVAVSRHSADSYILVFCENGDVYRLIVHEVSGTIHSQKVHSIFPLEAAPQPAVQFEENMK